MNNSKKIRSVAAIVFLSIVILFAILGSVFSLPSARLAEEKLVIESKYGIDKTMPQIIVIDTVNTLPDIKRVNKGISFLNRTKGLVTLSNGEKVQIFVYHNNPPYIYLEYKRANKVFFNFHNPEETRTFYRKLRVAKDKGQLP